MPRRRTEWAKVEAGFLFEDERFASLSSGEQIGYVKLWVYCVKVRREWFDLRSTSVQFLASRCSVSRQTFTRMVTACVQTGLLEKPEPWALVVPGVRAMHHRLQGWCVPFGTPNGTPNGGEIKIKKEIREEAAATPGPGGTSGVQSIPARSVQGEAPVVRGGRPEDDGARVAAAAFLRSIFPEEEVERLLGSYAAGDIVATEALVGRRREKGVEIHNLAGYVIEALRGGWAAEHEGEAELHFWRRLAEQHRGARIGESRLDVGADGRPFVQDLQSGHVERLLTPEQCQRVLGAFVPPQGDGAGAPFPEEDSHA